MAARAYILIEAKVGGARDVLHQIRGIQDVAEADIITGDYDVIALAESSDMTSLVDLVISQVQAIEGIERTITCVAT